MGRYSSASRTWAMAARIFSAWMASILGLVIWLTTPSEITVNSGSNRFDGISGATVSSKGVAAGVNTALAAAYEAASGLVK